MTPHTIQCIKYQSPGTSCLENVSFENNLCVVHLRAMGWHVHDCTFRVFIVIATITSIRNSIP